MDVQGIAGFLDFADVLVTQDSLVTPGFQVVAAIRDILAVVLVVSADILELQHPLPDSVGIREKVGTQDIRGFLVLAGTPATVGSQARVVVEVLVDIQDTLGHQGTRAIPAHQDTLGFLD